MRHAIAAVAALVAAFALAAPRAAAETRDPRTLSLGWLVEKAEVIAVVRPGETRTVEGAVETDLRVDEVLRGTLDPSATPVLSWTGHGEAAPWVADQPHLVFIEKVPAAAGAPTRWTPVSGPYGVKRLRDDGPEALFVPWTKEYAALLDDVGAPARPEALRALLVRWMGDADPGLTWSAALDFVRHAELHADLTGEQRVAVRDAFTASTSGRDPRRALAMAVAAAGGDGAAAALVDGLRGEGARLDRAALGEALRRLADPGAVSLLEARFGDAEKDPAAREDVLATLGLAADPAGLDLARTALADGVSGVRTEAAQALGLLARADRERRRGETTEVVPVEGRFELAAALEKAVAPDELRACLWALAQLEDGEAWALLRRVSADHPREEVRADAKRFLEKPRQSLFLR